MDYECAKGQGTREQRDHWPLRKTKGSTRAAVLLICTAACLLLAVCIIVFTDKPPRQGGVTPHEQAARGAERHASSKSGTHQERTRRKPNTRHKEHRPQRAAFEGRNREKRAAAADQQAETEQATSLISGTVHDHAGKPLPEAKLRLFRMERTFRYQIPRKEKLERTISTADGGYQFQGLPPGEYGIGAEHERYAPVFRGGIVLVKGLSRSDVDITLYRGGTIAGLVVDKEGKPIKTARLRIGDIFTGVSGNGRFVFHRVPKGARHIHAFAKHYEPTRSETLYVPQNGIIKDVYVSMKPGATISGMVVDGRDNPVAGARVRIVECAIPTPNGPTSHRRVKRYDPSNPDYFGSDRWREERTRQDGKFTFHSLKHNACYSFVARVWNHTFGYGSGQSGAKDVKIVLKRSGGITGRVTQRDDGGSVANAKVTCWSFSMAHFGFPCVYTTHTGEDGIYTFQDLYEGAYFLLAEAGALIGSPEKFVNVKEDEITKGVDFTLYPGMTISGHVVDAATLSPIESAIVNYISCDFLGRERTDSDGVLTDAQGGFRFENLREGTYMVYAKSKGYACASESDVTLFLADVCRGNVSVKERETPLQGPILELAYPGNTSDLLIELSPGGTLSGRTVDTSGEPIANAEITLGGGLRREKEWCKWSMSATSDSEGLYRFDGLPLDIVLSSYARHPDYVSTYGDPFTLSAEQPDHQVDLVFESGGTIVGKVVDTPGAPIENALVKVDRAMSEDAKTKKDGTYRMEHLFVFPRKITVSATGYATAVREDVAIEEGTETTVDFVLQDGAIIAGRVLDDQGNHLPRVSVSASRMGDRGHYVRSDENGHYRFADLSPGAYTIAAGRDAPKGYQSQSVKLRGVTTGREDVDIVFPEFKLSGAISGVVVDALTGAPVGKTKVWADDIERPLGGGGASDPTGDNGEFHIKDIQEGTYRLFAKINGYRTAEISPVIVVSGRTIDGIVFKLERGATVTGTLRWQESDRPVKSVYVRLSWGKDATGLVDRYTSGAAAQTDEEGEFTLEDVPPERYSLFVRGKPIKEVLVSASVTVNLGVIYISQPQTGTLVITFRDKDGQPLSRFPFHVRGDGDMGPPRGDNGRLVFEHVSSGRYLIFAGRNPERTIPVTIRAGDSERVDIELPAGSGRIFGQLSYDGEPLSDGSVRLFSRGIELEGGYSFDTRSDDYGRYEINHVPAGEYILYTRKREASGSYSTLRILLIAVAEGEDRQIDIEAGNCSLSGEIVDGKTGEPAPGARVRFRFALDPRDMPERIWNNYPDLYRGADAQGHFVFKNLQEGVCQLDAAKTGIGRSEAQKIEIRQGEAVEGVKVFLK